MITNHYYLSHLSLDVYIKYIDVMDNISCFFQVHTGRIFVYYYFNRELAFLGEHDLNYL